MIDLMLATQTALFDRLRSTVPHAAKRVFQHPPEKAEPPLIVIGDMRSENAAARAGQYEMIEFEIVSFYRGPSRAALFGLMHDVRQSLDDQAGSPPLSYSGVTFSGLVWTGALNELWEDGVTYQGTQTFQLHAQPAD